MTFNEISVSVPVDKTDMASAIANMVVPYGIYIEDYSDLEQGAKEIAHIDLIDEELLQKDRSRSVIHIYIPENENAVEASAFLCERFKYADINYEINNSSVNDESWKDNWKKFFKTTEIGERLVIKPSWETYEGVGRKILNIDPGAAFGTGTHATTKMCLALLEKYVFDGSAVLDIGCGSGILSIASVLLGAKSATGVDIDKTAVKISRENAELNRMSGKTEFINGNLTDKVEGKFDVICANIVADAIISLLPTVKQFMLPNSVLICSGIIDIRREEVEKEFKKQGYDICSAPSEDNWHAYAVRYIGR